MTTERSDVTALDFIHSAKPGLSDEELWDVVDLLRYSADRLEEHLLNFNPRVDRLGRVPREEQNETQANLVRLTIQTAMAIINHEPNTYKEPVPNPDIISGKQPDRIGEIVKSVKPRLEEKERRQALNG